jgi:hypothetical protein
MSLENKKNFMTQLRNKKGEKLIILPHYNKDKFLL